MDAAILGLTERIDYALDVARSLRDGAGADGAKQWMFEPADQTIRNLMKLRETALAGGLPRPSRGDVRPNAGLSLSRGIGDWTNDAKLLDAAYAIEDYYRAHV